MLEEFSKDKTKKPTRRDINEAWKSATKKYDEVYNNLCQVGESLYAARMDANNMLADVESLVNSIALTPKMLTTKVAAISDSRELFVEHSKFGLQYTSMFAKFAARLAAGSGTAYGTTSMVAWITTTFGTASTSAGMKALAGTTQAGVELWLSGGGSAGSAFLALSGPIGWTILGASIIASILLLWKEDQKIQQKKFTEIESLKANSHKLLILTKKMQLLEHQTITLADIVNKQLSRCERYRGKELRFYMIFRMIRLGVLVNTSKALASAINKTID